MTAKRRISVSLPVLWLLGLLFMAGMGVVTGMMLANAGVDRALHNTYYVVAHFHYVLSLGVMFVFFAAWYWLFPKISGYEYNETISKLHFCMTFFGANVHFFPQHFLSIGGMAHNYADYPATFATWNKLASFGSYITAGAIIVFLYGVFDAFQTKRRVEPN
jgi:cytochrome c oxidase subunit I